MRVKRTRRPDPYRYVSFFDHVTPAWLAAAGVVLITVIALFTQPYIGMADNGDFSRISYSNGLYFNAPDYGSQYLGYFVKKYGILQYYNENRAALFSSQSIFIHMAIWLNKMILQRQVFDIRVQAAIYTFLYAIAVYLLVEALTWKVPKKFGYMIAGLAVFVLGDTAYTAYFNSFYSESVVFIMMLFLFASVLLFYRKRYNDYGLMALFCLSGILLTTSKQQNAPVGIILAFAGVILVYIRKETMFRWTMASSLLVLALSGVGTYVLIPQEFVNINKYHAMTRGVMMESANPEATLEAFGIDKQYAVLNKSIYYDLNTTVDVNSKLLQTQFFSKYGFGSIMFYYFTHPSQAGKMLNLAAKDAFLIRPPAMGNYEKAVGKPFGAQTRFFSGYSLLKEALAPKTFGFIVLWIITVVGLYVPTFVMAIRARQIRYASRLPLLIMMMLVGLSGIIVSIIGAGDADLAKHEFLFTTAFDLVTLLTVADAISHQLWRTELKGGD